jgi:hypothetical protein
VIGHVFRVAWPRRVAPPRRATRPTNIPWRLSRSVSVAAEAFPTRAYARVE